MPKKGQLAASTLARVKALQGLPNASLDRLARAAEARRYPKGATIVQHLEPSRDFYIVLSGSVRVSMVASSGRALTYQVLEAGEAFGEVAAVDGLPRSTTIVVEEETTIACVTHVEFNALVSEFHEFATLVMTRMARLNRRLTERLFEFHAYDVRGRVLAELLRLTSTAEPSIQITDKDMASRVGTTRENVSRIHATLRKDGLVERRQSRLIVIDRQRLQEHLQDCEFS